MEKEIVKTIQDKQTQQRNNIMEHFVTFEKAHVKAHTTTSKTGKVSQVKEYENKKVKKEKKKLDTAFHLYTFPEFLKIVNKTPEKELKELMGEKEYIDTPGDYTSKKSDGDIVRYHEAEMNRENFQKLKNWYLENPSKTNPFVKNGRDISRIAKSQDNELEIQLFEDITKAHVKAHTKKTKTGKMVNVKEHDDKRKDRDHFNNKITYKKDEEGYFSAKGVGSDGFEHKSDYFENKEDALDSFKEKYINGTKTKFTKLKTDKHKEKQEVLLTKIKYLKEKIKSLKNEHKKTKYEHKLKAIQNKIKNMK